jgi:hypothetical protein
MTVLVKYHVKTEQIALFNSDGEYWIGSYNPHLAHQNWDEPMYSFIRGYWYTEDEGLAVLQTLTGKEF